MVFWLNHALATGLFTIELAKINCDSIHDSKCFCYFRCAIPMRERKRASAGSDGVCWSCPQCKTTKSIRKGSFSKSRKCGYTLGLLECGGGLENTLSGLWLKKQGLEKTVHATCINGCGKCAPRAFYRHQSHLEDQGS